LARTPCRRHAQPHGTRFFEGGRACDRGALAHAAGWDFAWTDAIADFGLHGALVVGARRDVSRGGVARLGRMPVRLLRNGTVVERGDATALDGGPLGSVDWLREELARYGRELAEGELVSTGSMTRVPAIAPGERWTIEATGGELQALSIDVV